MHRLSITLTDSQSRALELITAQTGATKQSIIGLALSSWVNSNYPQYSFDTPHGEEPECFFTIDRDGYEVAWYRGRWKDEMHKEIVVNAMRYSRDGDLQELSGTWLYTLQDDESVFVEDIFDDEIFE